MTETVTLVGAGPGGAELLTRGGGAALRQADAVVYDRLVDESILDLIPKGGRESAPSASRAATAICSGVAARSANT